MKLSIIIPVFRTEATLDRCVKSVVGQSFDDFEVILVDDGSPDRCPQLCDEWAMKDSRIIVVHQQNMGLSAARNAGIDRAKGEYLTFVDSDDYIGEDTLKEVMGKMGDNDLIEYPIWRFYGARHQSLLTFSDKGYASADDYWLSTQAYLHTYACNKIYRRGLFDGIRYPIGKVFEDVYTLPSLLRKAQRIATTSKGMYYYCWNEQGITVAASGEQLRMLLNANLSAQMPMNDDYYLHLLNIQIDVCERTDDKPLLPRRSISLTGKSLKQKTKILILNAFGINGICKISKIIHLFRKPSRS